MEYVKVWCVKHHSYKGIRPPRTNRLGFNCLGCWALYEIVNNKTRSITHTDDLRIERMIRARATQ